ncbi:Ig-like domain-containing protein [Stigmatella aurantiaca]|nr:Ig-like domain-containing protein [Stigmatella aurantiaca]ADO69601.1 Ig-like domain protein [Stigmatella aurantiaca DW4/3-1]
MKHLKTSLWFTACLMVLAGCGSDDSGPTDPGPEDPGKTPQLSAVTVTCTPTTLTAGQSSQCTASATDQDGKPFSVPGYTWASSNEAVAKVDATGKASPFAVGTASITASATAGGITRQGQATLTISEIPSTPHTQNITSNETWRAAQNPHVVYGTLEVTGTPAPTLTLEAGVEILFAENAELRITQGALRSTGTPEAPVRLKAYMFASLPTQGAWRGVVFAAEGSASEVAHTVLTDCGGTSGAGACLAIQGRAAPVLRNVTVQNSASAGILLSTEDSAFGAGTTGLHITGSETYAVRIHANQAGTLPEGNTFTANTHNAVELQGTVSRTQTWPNPGTGIAYVVPQIVTIEGTSKPILTIAAGNTLRFGPNARLGAGLSRPGNLVVDGTPQAPVLFTADSATPQPGHWQGVHLGGDSSNASRISHATIEYGGAEGGNGLKPGNLNIYGNYAGTGARPVLTHLLVQRGSKYGVYVEADGGFDPASTALSAHNNGGYAISLQANAASTLPVNGTFSGNTPNAVELQCCYVTTTQTWPNLGIPYVLPVNIGVGSINAKPTLTLLPGTQLRFGADVDFQIGKNAPGALVAVGTPTEPIQFVPDAPTPTKGHWRGLHFWQASGSKLEYVTVSYAGAEGSIGNGNVNVYRGETGAFITNSTLSYSSKCGITVSNGAGTGTTPVSTDFTNPDYHITFTGNLGRQCIN